MKLRATDLSQVSICFRIAATRCGSFCERSLAYLWSRTKWKLQETRPGNQRFAYAWRLKKLGQLPGLSSTDTLANDNYSFNVTFVTHPDSDLEPQAQSDLKQQTVVTLYSIQKKGDSSLYFYEVRRARRNGSWRLEKAWTTDFDGKTLEHLLP